MSWLSKLLGHNGTARPCVVTVTYRDGSTGTLSLWVMDAADALTKGQDWILDRDTGIRRIVFELQERPEVLL